jgi:hypothetical protein
MNDEIIIERDQDSAEDGVVVLLISWSGKREFMYQVFCEDGTFF